MTPTTITLSPEHQEWLDATFARNRAQFGGFVMETDPDPEPEPDPDPAKADPDPEPDPDPDPEPDPKDEDPEDPDDDDDDGELDLDGAKKALAKVRKSEAKMRTRLRDIEAKLAEAKTPEQIEELLAGVRSESAAEARDLMVENVALKAGVPEALWDRLKGDTREDLEADAKALAALLPGEPSDDPDLKGGLDPEDEPGDDVAAMRKAMDANRRRRR